MAIPQNISPESIIQALDFIDKNSVPERRQSVDYDLVYQGNCYPPKYVISKANFFENGIDLEASEFSGGDETNRFLISRGFQIEPRTEEIESYSWTIINSQVAIKRLDRSAFHHNGTGVPIEVRPFFGIDGLLRGETRDSVLIYNGKRYAAIFSRKRDNDSTGRTQLHWHSDFEEVLRTELPKWNDNDIIP